MVRSASHHKTRGYTESATERSEELRSEVSRARVHERVFHKTRTISTSPSSNRPSMGSTFGGRAFPLLFLSGLSLERRACWAPSNVRPQRCPVDLTVKKVSAHHDARPAQKGNHA